MQKYAKKIIAFIFTMQFAYITNQNSIRMLQKKKKKNIVLNINTSPNYNTLETECQERSLSNILLFPVIQN